MLTTDIYVNPLDDHPSTVAIPARVQGWLLNVHFDNIMQGEPVAGFAWSIHGRYKNTLQIASQSMTPPATGTVFLNNSMALGQSCYLTCTMTAYAASGSLVTISYTKTIQLVSANL